MLEARTKGRIDVDGQDAECSGAHAPCLYAGERPLQGCKQAKCVEAAVLSVRLLTCTHAHPHLHATSMLSWRALV